MRAFRSAETREAHRSASQRGGHAATALKRDQRREGMAAAHEWRESRRCKACGALAYVACEHRPRDVSLAGGPIQPTGGR